MDEVIDYLTNIPAWFFATCEGDQPRVRPFSFAAEDGGKLWFCTATNKDVYVQLEANTLNSKHRVGILDSLGS